MPRTHAHPLNRYACYTDRELRMCDPVAFAVVKAANSTKFSDQWKAVRKSGAICRAFATCNRQELRRGVETMQINHIGRLKALKESLKNAGENRLDASVNTILVVGHFLQVLPQFVGLPSLIKNWKSEPISWLHWLELAPICRCDIAEYPLPYTLSVAQPPCPDRLNEPLVDPHLHEICCTRNEFIGAIAENYRRFDHFLTRIVTDSLTPRQVRLQRDQMIDELL